MGNIKNYGYFKEKSLVPDYDKILFGKVNELPKKYMDWFAEIKWMTKEQYLMECSKIQNTSYSDQFRYIIENKTQKILEMMKNGVKFDMPYLNYVENTQEGRHRVTAADMLGQKYIPVLVLDNVNQDISYDISDMLNKWDDLVIKNDLYYVKFNIEGWKTENMLLSCITPDYDYYYLDVLFNLKKNNMSIEDYIFKSIKNGNLLYSNFSYINKNNIYYDGEFKKEFSKDFLLYCFMLKILRKNDEVIFDCVIYEKDTYYLKIIPQKIDTDFNYYKNCKEMMLDNSKNKYYIKEYDLLSTDDYSDDLYIINDNDIKTITKIYSKINNVDSTLQENINRIKKLLY